LGRKFDQADLRIVRDLSAYPELRWLDRAFLLPPLTVGLSAVLLGRLLPGTSVFQMLVWGFSISTVLVYHSTFAVNSLAHRFGARPFDTKDNSRNNLFVAAIMMGEGFHNNHHRFPTSARFGFEPWQIDIGYCTLVVLEKLGVVWDIRAVLPSPVRAHSVLPRAMNKKT
jgi:stearoyl-CoA desaturase (delta-9 desaturase)